MESLLYIAKSIGILSLFYVVYMLVLRQDTFFTANRAYLLSAIIAAVTFPFIQFTTIATIAIPAALPTAQNFISLPTQTIPEVVHPFDWWEFTLLIYSLGVIVLLCRFVLQLVSLAKLIQSGSVRRIGHFNYVTVNVTVQPFSFFNYIVYNPALHPQEELDMILTHERVHASQWHSLDVLLTQGILILQWCNPLAWFFKKSVEQNLEYIADSAAAQAVVSATAYQRTLVKVSSTTYRPALTTNFYHSLIKKRIVMLNKQSSHKGNLLKLGLIIPALALFMYSFNVKEEIRYEEGTISNDAFAKAVPDILPDASAEVPMTYTVTATMSDAQIDKVITALENEAQGLTIKFTNRKRTALGALASFTVKTKYADQNRFHQNIVYENTNGMPLPDVIFQIANGNDLQFSDFDNTMIFKTSKKGVQAEMTESGMAARNAAKKQTPKPLLAVVSPQQTAPRTTSVISVPENQNIKPVKTPQTDYIYQFRITKNETLEGLKKLQADIKKDHNATFEFSDVNFNAAGEIIGIHINFKDSTNEISHKSESETDTPINDIIIYKEVDGGTGIVSLPAGETVEDQKEKFKKRSEAHRKAMEELRETRQAQMEERRLQGQARLEQRRAELEQRREERKAQYRERRNELQGKASQDQKNAGYLKVDGETYYFVRKEDTTQYFNRWGAAITEGEVYEKLRAQREDKETPKVNLDFSSGKALFIIDGKEIEGDLKDDLKGLDPNDIKNVTVLKGEQAIKKYKDKGKNGVIIIETKSKTFKFKSKI